jgi:hypothetical protein
MSVSLKSRRKEGAFRARVRRHVWFPSRVGLVRRASVRNAERMGGATSRVANYCDEPIHKESEQEERSMRIKRL